MVTACRRRCVQAGPASAPPRCRGSGSGSAASTTISIKVNVLEAPTTTSAAAPNKPATSGQITALGGAGSGGSVSWLYPYASTFFPLGLPAPILQYSFSSGSGGAVKATLRYPANSSAAAAKFNYALIVKEENTVSQSAGVALSLGNVASRSDRNASIDSSGGCCSPASTKVVD